MKSNVMQLEVLGQPPHVRNWSVAGIPGFIPAVLDRWQRNQGRLPDRFMLIACPLVEINAAGGLPGPVRELTNPRLRFQHFTGCHKPYLIILLVGEENGVVREKVQKMLSWSEGYQVEFGHETTRLQFIESIEDCEGAAG